MFENIMVLVFVFALVVVAPILVVYWIIRSVNAQSKYTNEGIAGINDDDVITRNINEANNQNEQATLNLAKMLNSLPTALMRAKTVPSRSKAIKTSAIRILESLVNIVSQGKKTNISINNYLIIDGMKINDYDKEEFPLDIKIIRLLNTLNTLLQKFEKDARVKNYDSEEIMYQTIFWAVRQNEQELQGKCNLGNLRYTIVADEIISNEEQAKRAIPLIVGNIANEKTRWVKESNWGTGLAASLLLGGFGSLLTAVIVTTAKNVALDVTSRQTAQSLLLLTPASINSQTFSKMPDQASFLASMHACGTGLAKLGAQYSTIIKQELSKLKRSQNHERAILAFALAVNGEISVIETLRNLTLSDDWLAKIIAYEGLIALANSEDTGHQVKVSEQITALDDRDLRVSTYIAHVLTSTQNPLYKPQLVKLAESHEDSLRMASLHTLFVQALNGDEIASTKLKSMAEQDKDNNVREQAGKYVIQLSGDSITPSLQSTSEHTTLEHEKKKTSNQNVKIIASIAFGITGFILGCMGILVLSVPPDPSIDTEPSMLGTVILCFVPAILFIIISIGLGIWAARGKQAPK